MKLIILTFLISFSAFAQISTAPRDLSCPACPECPPCAAPVEERNSATNRDASFGTLLGGFQFLDTWVPSKFTGSYTQIFNKAFSLELEYANASREIEIASVDLGELSEERFTLLLKYYVGKTFHISLGPYVNKIEFELGDKIRNAAGDRVNGKASIDIYGISFGIGNRWQFNNGFTIGVDWLRINQPTGKYNVEDRIFKDVEEENQDEVKRTGSLFKNFPAFTFVGVNIGYTF